MADIQKTIEIIFTGADQLSGTIDKISGNLSTFDAGVQSIARPLAGVADQILKLDAAIAAFAAGGLTYAFAKSAEFQGSMIDLEKVLSSSELKQMGGIREEVIALADTYGVSATKIMASIAGWKQAGYDAAESTRLAKDTLDLVIAGDIGAADATERLVSIMKGFRLEAGEAGTVIDALNSVSNQYATDTKQLAIGLGDLAPIAKQAGFTFQETTGLVTPIIEVFRSGSEAAVAMKTGLLRLTDDRGPVVDMLTQLGISQKTVNGEFRSGKDIFLDVAGAFKALDENEKLYVASTLVGIDQAGRMVTAFDQLAKYSEIAAVAMDSSGSAAAEVAKRLASSEVAVERFKVGFENLGIAVGDQFRIAATEAITGGTAIETALRKAVETGAFDKIFDALEGFAGDLGDSLQNIAKMIPDALKGINFDNLLDAFGNVRETISGIFDFDLSTPEGLRAAIQEVIDAIALLVNVGSGIASNFEPVVDAIREFIARGNEMGGAFQEDVGRVLGAAKLLVDAGTWIGGFLLTVQQAGASMSGAFDGVIASVQGVYYGLRTVFDAIVQIVAGVSEGVLEAFETIADAVTVIPGVPDEFGESIAKAREKMGELREITMESTAENLQKSWDNLAIAFDGATYSAGKTKETVEGMQGLAADISVGVVVEEDQADKNLSDLRTKMDALGILKVKPTIEEQGVDTALDSFFGDVYAVNVGAEVDRPSIDAARGYIEEILPDGTRKFTQIGVEVDQPSVDKAKKALDDIKPLERAKLEVELETARIEADAKTIQEALKFRAEVDIAELEAMTKQIETTFETIRTGYESSGELIMDSFGAIGDFMGKDATSTQMRYELLAQIERENELRQAQLEMQQEMTRAQIEYMAARQEALENGEPFIKVTMDGRFQPALELMAEEFIRYCQIQASEQGLESLLGV